MGFELRKRGPWGVFADQKKNERERERESNHSLCKKKFFEIGNNIIYLKSTMSQEKLSELVII